MKKFAELVNEVKIVSKTIASKEEAKTKLTADLTKSINLDARELEYKKCQSKRREIEQSITDLKIEREILKNNARIALFKEAVPVIVETLSKYKGKPYGEKTRDKICKEISEKISANFYISSKYGSGSYELFPLNVYGNEYNITIFPSFIVGDPVQVLNENKINVIPEERLALGYVSSEYVENIPERIEELKCIRNEAYEMQSKLRSICSRYNSKAVGNIPQIYAEKYIYDNFAI